MPSSPAQPKENPAWLGRLNYPWEWDDELLSINAMVDGFRIAWTTASLHHPTAMRINDLVVDDEFDTRRLIFLGRLRHRQPINPRGHRIGARLLDQVIEKAAGAGVQVLHGAVVSHDLAEQPWLPSFYERRGFLLLPPTEEEKILPAAVYRIELRLS